MSSELCTEASDVVASFWYKEFEERFRIDKLEEREFERLRALEVEDYLWVHRNSRRKQKIGSDYIGRKIGLLSIHKLEYRYLQQDFQSRKKKLMKDHKKWIIDIQKQAFENNRLPPLVVEGASSRKDSDAKFSFTELEKMNITSNPPVLRESRGYRVTEAELLRQLKIKENLIASDPAKGEYFPSVL